MTIKKNIKDEKKKSLYVIIIEKKDYLRVKSRRTLKRFIFNYLIFNDLSLEACDSFI